MASAKGEKFITLFIGKYNLKTRLLTYVNAAHNPPLLVTDTSVNILKLGCTGLGMFDKIDKIEEGAIEIHPKSTIVCYTDGLVETLGTITEQVATNTWTSYIDLSIPSGGWTWPKIQALEVKAYGQDNGISAPGVYRVEVEAYNDPIPGRIYRIQGFQ